MGRGRIVATGGVLSLLIGPLPLVPIVRVGLAPAAALACGTRVEAATAAPDPVTGTAALQAAIDGAATAPVGCADWTVTVAGTFDLTAALDHAAGLPLVLTGPVGARAELRGDGTDRLLAIRRPATDVTLVRLVLRDGDATGTDLDGAGGAVGAEVGPLADPTPSRVTVIDALLVGNAAASGGAVAADEVVLTDVDVVGNDAALGGAIDAGTVTATRVQFTGNTATLAPGQGGAVRASGDVTLTTVTMTGNAASAGGSVWMSGVADPVLRAVATTFADARADVGGHLRGDASLGGSVRTVLRGTVLAGVTALSPGAAAPDVCAGLVGHPGPAPDLAASTWATDGSCPGATPLAAEPLLTVLVGADGTVEERVRLLVPEAAGPLIDAAPCSDVWPAVDARGAGRPQPAGGACDVGAVELVPGGGTGDGGDDVPDPDAVGPASDPDPGPTPGAIRAGAAGPGATHAPEATGPPPRLRAVLDRMRRR